MGADGRWSWVDLSARPAGDSLPPGQHAVVFEPGDPQAMYVANEGGLFRSPDGGRSWRSLGTGLAVAEVSHLADHAAWLLAAAGELGTLRYEGGEVWCPSGRATRRSRPAASWSPPARPAWSSPPTAGRPGPPSICRRFAGR